MARTIRRLFLLGLLFALLPRDYAAGRTAPDTVSRYNRAAAPVAPTVPMKLAGTMHLHPNPASGQVEIAFTQEVGAAGRLLLYDAYRQHVREVVLKGESGTVELNVAGLRPGLYYYIHWMGNRKGQTGTLVVQP